MFIIYWLISENKKDSYVGFSDSIKRRLSEHQNRQVKTTKAFGKFRCFILEKVETVEKAREREIYWKSCAGRKKLKSFFEKIN